LNERPRSVPCEMTSSAVDEDDDDDEDDADVDDEDVCEDE
jgi:hypothetical protein